MKILNINYKTYYHTLYHNFFQPNANNKIAVHIC